MGGSYLSFNTLNVNLFGFTGNDVLLGQLTGIIIYMILTW